MPTATEIGSIWEPDSPYGCCEAQSVRVLADSVTRSVSASANSDPLLITGLVQNTGEGNATFNEVHVRAINDEGAVAGGSSYFPYFAGYLRGPRDLEPGAVAPFGVRIDLGPGEGKFVAALSYNVTDYDEGQQYFDLYGDGPANRTGQGYTISSVSTRPGQGLSVTVALTNALHPSKTGYVFLVGFASTRQATGFGCAEYVAPADGSVTVELAENIARQPASDTKLFSVHFTDTGAFGCARTL